MVYPYLLKSIYRSWVTIVSGDYYSKNKHELHKVNRAQLEMHLAQLDMNLRCFLECVL